MQKQFSRLKELINNYIEPYNGDYLYEKGDNHSSISEENNILFFVFIVILFILFFILLYFLNK